MFCVIYILKITFLKILSVIIRILSCFIVISQIIYDIALTDLSDVTINVSCLYRREYRVSKNVSIHIFWMLLNISFKHWNGVIYACIKVYISIYVDFNLILTKIYFYKTLVNWLKFQIISMMLHFFFIHVSVYCMVYQH